MLVRVVIYAACRLFGITVKDIAAAPGVGKRADFVLCDGAFKYIVELKSCQSIFPRLDIAEGGGHMGISDGRAIPKIFLGVRKAVQQISETKKQPEYNADYCLIWIHVYDEAMCHRVEDAFYGSLAKHLFSGTADSNLMPYTVYYANQCIFANKDNRVIDAVVITTGEVRLGHGMSYQLCINSFGTQYEQFKLSQFARKFMAIGEVLDPMQLESKGSALVVDDIEVSRFKHKGEFESSNIILSPEVQDFIKKKYGKVYGCSLQPVTTTVSFPLSKFINVNGDNDGTA